MKVKDLLTFLQAQDVDADVHIWLPNALSVRGDTFFDINIPDEVECQTDKRVTLILGDFTE